MGEDIFSSLSRFGLSNYEIKLYRVLLLYGPNTPTGAVKIAGVPQPRMVGYYEIADIRGINGNVITRYVGEMYIPLCVDV